MRTIQFTANDVVFEGEFTLTLSNDKGDWLTFSYDAAEVDAAPHDPTGRVYTEFCDQGNGAWGGIKHCALTADRLVLVLEDERDDVLTIGLQLDSSARAKVEAALDRVFIEAPSRLVKRG